jgi:bacillithiol biosynthesis cysteine-adding enzyme BshC
MDCRCIRHTEIPHASRLFADYLYDFARVREFYAFNPFEEESFRKAAQSFRYGEDLRRQVVSVLREQNERFSAAGKTFDNLKRLESPDCFAVVTGQQVGLFTGPAFAVYKALTAIKLAQNLSRQGLPAVPIFWLATEDHDLNEVNHCFVQDREGSPQRLEYSEAPPLADAPVGSIRFTGSIRAVLDSMRSLLPDAADSSELLRSLSECYRPEEGFGMAFGRFMARLFADFGVVQVDPMDARLHGLSRAVFQAAVESAPALQKDLLERNRRLAEAGYHLQVRVTESSSLLFLYSNGQRTPLRLTDGQFVSSQGRRFSPGELMKVLEQQPEMFSPNVLLRPVMQDALLPTIAYVGGPSELAYLAQAGVIYQRVLGRTPVLFPRASLTILDAASNRLLGKYGLTLPDVYAGKQGLREKMAARFLPPDLTEVFRKTAAGLEESLGAVQKALALLDPTLVDAAANSGRKMQYQLSSLERKAAAAIQSRSEQIERDAARLENNLYPQKTVQERLYSGVSFLGRYGPRLLHEIYDQISLHCRDHQVITP